MPTCCFPLCKMSLRTSTKENLKVKFHKFPIDSAEKLRWLKNIGRTLAEYKNGWKICSLHFAKTDYIPFTNRLLKNSVPNLSNGIDKFYVQQKKRISDLEFHKVRCQFSFPSPSTY